MKEILAKDVQDALLKINDTELVRDNRRSNQTDPIKKFRMARDAAAMYLGIPTLISIRQIDLLFLETASFDEFYSDREIREFVYNQLNKIIEVARCLDLVEPDEKGRKELPWFYYIDEVLPVKGL